MTGLSLASLPDWAFAFVLVLCRTSAVLMVLPGLGETAAPAMVRAGLAMTIAGLILPAAAPLVPAAADAPGMAAMVAAELLTGAAIGWLARLPMVALSMAGAVISTMTGLTSVVQPDPELGGQSSILARLFTVLAPVLVLSTGLYAVPLTALARSYQLIPPGALLPSGPLAETILAAVSAALDLTLRLAAPFVFTSILLQCGLGLLARLVPQLQVFTIAAPGQILGGLVLLGLLAAPLLNTWSDSARAAWALLPGH